MRRLILAAVIFSITTSTSAQILNPQNGHYYKIFPIPAGFTWQQSRDSCIALEGYLATVTDDYEQWFAYALVSVLNSTHCWIGGTDELQEGTWQWANGQPFVYVNWRPGEPNNAFDGEDYMEISSDWVGQWNDARNAFIPAGHFIVEWDSRPCCSGTKGDVNGDGNRADVLDLSFLVSRIFRSGPASECPRAADINSDWASENILDLNFLVNRLFRDGPPPGECY